MSKPQENSNPNYRIDVGKEKSTRRFDAEAERPLRSLRPFSFSFSLSRSRSLSLPLSSRGALSAASREAISVAAAVPPTTAPSVTSPLPFLRLEDDRRPSALASEITAIAEEGEDGEALAAGDDANGSDDDGAEEEATKRRAKRSRRSSIRVRASVTIAGSDADGLLCCCCCGPASAKGSAWVRAAAAFPLVLARVTLF